MSHALFDILQGRYADGTALGSPHEAQSVMRSIRDHLTRLLNARSGSLRHLPDYGLPDLPSLYTGLPYSQEDLASAVRELILRYEPRLKQVQVRHREQRAGDCVVHFEVTGVLADGQVARFTTYFHSAGQARVRPAALHGGAHA